MPFLNHFIFFIFDELVKGVDTFDILMYTTKFYNCMTRNVLVKLEKFNVFVAGENSRLQGLRYSKTMHQHHWHAMFKDQI